MPYSYLFKFHETQIFFFEFLFKFLQIFTIYTGEKEESIELFYLILFY
jgi:hypothetical protein